MKKFDIVIIGSGLGGLQCGYILSKQGYNVCVLEKNSQFGGALQSFKRNDNEFDTGFHYVGGLKEGQPLHTLFKYFDLLKLPWHQLDENGFDEILFNDKSYLFANGFERFAETLAKDFPKQREDLKHYSNFLKEIGLNFFDVFNTKNPNEIKSMNHFSESAYNFLSNSINDSLLQNVLSGNSLKMELNAKKLPLYIFAQINSSFIQSAWRLKGSGSLIIKSLINSILEKGGTVLNNAKVTQLIEKNRKIKEIEINGTDRMEADYVISNIHPTPTFELVKESSCLRKVFRNRIFALDNTFGMFTVNMELKKDVVPYRNRNIFIYNTNDIWKISEKSDNEKIEGVFVSFQVPANGGKFAQNIDILTPMNWSCVEKWKGTNIAHRGAEYEEFKAKHAEKCIQLVSKYIPELKNGINRIFTSTPLTYYDYTETVQGSAYGIQKDYNQLLYTMLPTKTPISNLFLTGQNINFHGVLGVSVTSIYTCAEIVGKETLFNEIIDA